VNQLIKNLLGLEAGQFRQVVMIPQGDFRRLLISGSDERESLMEKLFDTGPYKAVQERLKEMEEASEKDIRFRREKQDQLTADLSEISKSEDLMSFDEESAIAILEERLERLDEENAAASRALETAAASLERAKALFSDCEQFDSLKAEREKLEERRESMETLRENLDIFRKALALEDRYRNLIAARVATKKANQESEEVGKRLESLRKNRILLDSRMEKKPDLTERYDSVSRQIRVLEPFRDEYAGMASLLRRIEDVQIKSDEAEKRRLEYVQERDRAVERKDELDLLLEDLGRSGTPDERLEMVRKLESFLQLKKTLEIRESEFQSAEVHLADAEKANSHASKILEALEDGRWKDMSGQLAAELADGVPCPVCGSLHHPHPAEGGEGPGAEELEQARAEMVSAGELLSRARGSFGTAEALVLESRRALESLASELGEDAENPETGLRTLREEAVRESELRAERESILGTQMPDISTKLEGLSAEAEGFRRELKGLIDTRDERTAAWERAVAGFSDDSAIPQLADLPERLDDWQAETERLSDELQSLDAESQRLDESIRQAEAEAVLREEYRAASELDLDTRTQAFSRMLESSGFENEGVYRDALEHASSIDDDSSEYESWMNRRTEISTLLGEVERRIDGKAKPDIAVVSQERDRLSQEAAQIAGRLARGKETLRRLRETWDRFRELEEETRESDLRHGVLRRLTRQVRGVDPPRISLNRFFLARRLEEVLIQATRRLSILSRGRFTLKRLDEGGSGNSQAGLDLLVSDGWTGTDRPVRTLSGGQLFMASLALALGLADVVQARSGGVKLEALFIDEGFGTLDDESLQGVLGVLNDLREDRMVGVISHVPELRRQISNRIEVGRDSVGSNTRIVLGT
jgi:exonuclease SbcC